MSNYTAARIFNVQRQTAELPNLLNEGEIVSNPCLYDNDLLKGEKQLFQSQIRNG